MIAMVGALGAANAPRVTAEPRGEAGSYSLVSKKYVGDSYILGPGDGLLIEILDIPEYSGVSTIGPDGSMYLPRIRSLQVEGMTIDELRYLLTQEYSKFVKDPEVYINPISYRPVRVYVGGEVRRPGYYYLTQKSTQTVSSSNIDSVSSPQSSLSGAPGSQRSGFNQSRPIEQARFVNRLSSLSQTAPTLFDAIRDSGGITPYSNLSEVVVIRNRPLSQGGGKVKTTLDFFSLITSGDESQNIKLYDGDSIFIPTADTEFRQQIIKAGKTNLNPDFIRIFVSGRVREPGLQILPQGASLEQAIASAGGTKILRGTIEFIRFNRDGTTDKRQMLGVGGERSGSYTNPILMPGDIIRVNDSPLTALSSVVGELLVPAIGAYSAYSLYTDFTE